MNIGSFYNFFYSKKQLSEATKKTYIQNIKTYHNYLQENKFNNTIDNAIRWIESSENGSSFMIRRASITAYFLKMCEEREAVEKYNVIVKLNKLSSPKVNRGNKKLNYINYREVEKISEHTTDIISCFILFLFWTGCRISEAINIKINDCKTENDYVKILIYGKGKSERHVFLPVEIFNKINTLFNGKEFLFETRRGNHYNKTCVTREIHRQTKRVLGFPVTPITLRHSKAMYLKSLGVQIDDISKIMGHKNGGITIDYYLNQQVTPEIQGM